VGGANHNLAGSYNVIAGGSSAYIADSTTHSIIMAGANNTIEKSVDAAGSYSNFIGGGSSNQIHGLLSAIIGSSAGHTYGSNISLIGCSSCEARDTASAILGGALSSTLAAQSVIFGGYDNDVTNSASIGSGIISGYGNKIGTGLRTTILAGRSNQITSGDSSTILGGRDNQIAAGTYSSIIGGLNNYIDGINSMVINAFKLTADGPGHFMIGDKQPGPLATCNWPTSCPSAQQTVLATAAGSNSFTARFSGGFRFCTNGDCSTGKYIDAAASSWTSISDKNQKEAFGLINPEEILTSFSKLEIPSWNYKAQNDKSKKIIGPMAQDFYQLFAKPYKLFSSDKTIDQADLNGIILVGIKGLEARTVNLRSDQSKIEIKINSMNEEIDEVRNMIQLLSKRNK
jgi:hypothetical protein